MKNSEVDMVLKRIICCILCLIMLLPCMLMPASAYSVADGNDAAYDAAAEAMVLLKNERKALPLTSNDKIAIFGEGQVYTDGKTGGYFLMGRGSGYFVPTKTPPSPCDLLSSYASRGKLGGVYTPLSASYKSAASAASGTDFSYSPTDAEYKAAAEYADKAVYILNRTSAEGSDISTANYSLTSAERSELTKLSKAFGDKPVIVVLNCGSVIDCGFANGRIDGIRVDALITAQYLGICGVEALCDALVGEVNPSGKLVDTYAKKLTDYPSYRGFYESNSYSNYYEDIYVGYRYFETFGKEVDYPFGYGLSYTSFETSDVEYTESGGRITVSVKVTNTGKVSGREVVQLYFGAPQKGTGSAVLSKASKELCGFAKTKLLAPSESERVSISFEIDSMASYDDLGKTGNKSAYVMEAGDYTVYVGNSVQNTRVAGVHKESALRVTEQLSELCEPTTAFERMTYDGTEKIGGGAVARKDILHVQRDVAKTTPDTPIQFSTVLSGECSMDEFLSQMTDEELCYFAVMTHASSTNTKAWGGSAEMAEKYGIPTADTCDGPAGLRISTKGTGLPCATALACTWNREAVARLGDVIGREAVASSVDIWLAPAMNIHRFPLCGRNFEYYSEDPYLSGAMASEIVRAVEAHGIATSIKHFVGNERENHRSSMSSNMSERVLREIYLMPFKMCVEAGASTVMTSYNKLNNTETAEHAELLRGILRGEWGFDGLITTDWSNDSSLEREVIAGNNVKSSGDAAKLSINMLQTALRTGQVTRSLLFENATYVLKLLAKLPDGVRLANPPVHKVSSSGKSMFEAEDFTHKHGYSRPEITGSRTVMAYTRAFGTDWIPYLSYTLDVEKEGYYVLSVGLANNAGAAVSDSLRVFVDGVEQECAFNAENTGSWSAVSQREVTRVYLPKGRVTLKVKSAENRFCGNFDNFTLQPIEEAYTAISSADELLTLMRDSSKWKGKYYLTSDIDLTGKEGQSPIGTFSVNFMGVFDGMGHSVSGVNISSSSERDVGLFGKIRSAVIRDLKVYGTVESAYPNAVVGGIVGTADPGAVVIGCENYASVSYTEGKTAAKGVGGIAGYLYSGTIRVGSTIKNCTNYGAVSSHSGGADANLGGIVGVCQNYGVGTSEIRGCINKGALMGEGDRVGGIVGYLTQAERGGGVFVYANENRADVSGTGAKVGGLIGYVLSKSTTEGQIAEITDCINRAAVSGGESAQDVDELIGRLTGGLMKNCEVKEPIEEPLPDIQEPQDTQPESSDMSLVGGAEHEGGTGTSFYIALTVTIVLSVAAIVLALVLTIKKKNGKTEKDSEKTDGNE